MVLVEVPLATVVSVPFSVPILEDVSFVVPVTLIPLPGSSVAAFRWAIVVPSAGPPSVPDTSIPLPPDGWSDSLGAVSADNIVPSVRLNPSFASSLGTEDLSILSNDVLVSSLVDSVGVLADI